ncbi:T9SS type A sorting domain-containing protein [Tenacibaculum agarivorans]|uniref:T9SS type A sorting domain-containing protein n=1 Tax=Tenacibaculum agarivorans TaxID=1908389 RepID=UPI00094BB0B5|nr:T9SS type A sorting domain-containing protein [Tenacibaculum agarivorans]
MRKIIKIIIVIQIFFSSIHFINGQESYYELDITGYVGDGGRSCGTQRGLQWIELVYENGARDTYFNPGIYENRALVTPRVKFYRNNRIIQIRFHTNSRYRDFGCKSRRSTLNLNISNLDCTNHSFDFSASGLTVAGNAKVVIKPIIKLRDPGANNNFGSNDYINIAGGTGVDNGRYFWEYSFRSFGSYNLLPSYTWRNNNLRVRGLDFLNEARDHGKLVYFRVNTYCNSSVSNPVAYRFLRDAPRFVSSQSDNTKCYGTNDGKVKLTFDRRLSPGETLSLTSTNPNFPGTHVNLTSADFDSSNAITIEGLAPGTYPIRMVGFYRGFNTFINTSDHRRTITINRPDPVEFFLNKTDVFCHGGADGAVKISAKGGRSGVFQYTFKEVNDTSPIQDSDWKTFTNSGVWPYYQVAEVVENLKEGKYKVSVRDANGCEAKEVKRDGAGRIIGINPIVNKEIEVKQPDKPLRIELTSGGTINPSGFGFSDGQIVAHVTGGTPLGGGKYNYTWTHEKNGVLTTWTNFKEEIVSGEEGWFITLENAIDGKYSLTVTDENFSGATNKGGCNANIEVTLTEPNELTVTIQKTNAISCNPNNTFGDTADDGELTAIADGGIPFDPLLDGKYKYEYTWKKKDASGNYQVIPGENGNVLSMQETGEYAVNIKDQNGVIVGTYVNNILDKANDATYNLTPPDLLKIEYTKQNVFCYQGTDGSIDVTITGGTGAYTVKWSNNKTTEDIDGLIAGSYMIKVTDDKGCQAEKTIQIEEPKEPLKIVYSFFEPTFAGATNGWLEATITGGTPLDTDEYTYFWKDSNGNNLNGQVSSSVTSAGNVLTLTGLGEGEYYLTIQDKNYPLATDKPSCTIIESEYILDDPEPLEAIIQIQKPISCSGTNIYGDPYTDGVLEVLASGGIKLQPNQNNGLSYYYTWKKETSPGVWTVLPLQTTNIASGLGEGNYAVNIKDANGIVLGEYQNNVLVQEKDITQSIKEPELLEVEIKKQNAYCIGGSDGWIEAKAIGGTAPYTFEWEDGRKTPRINDLSQGFYKLIITDKRGCRVEVEVPIEEPKEPLKITFSEFATPSTKDASNGWIKAIVEGGTPDTLGAYTYYWQDESGNLLNAQTVAQFINNTYEITLNTIPKGKYYLTIEDANYNIATTKEGCTHIDEEFILYDPIEATISVETPISCNQNNVFNNPFSDGALKVEVTGGLPFASGNPYVYTWKKQNSAGVYEDLGVDSLVVSGISEGNYAVNVEDSRGVIIGEYNSLNLIKPSDELFAFKEPELLTVSLTATEISCEAGNNGTATVTIFGGIPPYDIQWSNGDITETATNLIATNYVVFVTDARGCQATGNITLTPPGGLKIEPIVKKDPTCFNGSDGEIQLQISGGVTPYTYSWDTGETTTSISNLEKGSYSFSLEDAKGCKAFVEFILEDPEEIIIDLGEDKTLCNNQSFVLNGSINDANATYVWTSDKGFTSTDAEVTVTEGGTYTVTATSKEGCTATDTITISYSNLDIDAELIMSSQAFVNEEVVIFNGSNHSPESFEWILPDNITLVEERSNSIVVKFTTADSYEIGLTSKQGECFQTTYKTIVIEETDVIIDDDNKDLPFIESFTISPNPNSGVFTSYVKLADPSKISIRIFNLHGELMKKSEMPEIIDEHETKFNVPMSSGMYIVVLETPKQTQVRRMIVK